MHRIKSNLSVKKKRESQTSYEPKRRCRVSRKLSDECWFKCRINVSSVNCYICRITMTINSKMMDENMS